MFHSLYHSNANSSVAPTKPDDHPTCSRAFLNWPASYLDGFRPFDAHRYQLEVCGLVERPHTFSFQELMSFTRVQQNRRLVFADGWSYRNTWEGFVVQELLHRVAPRPQARFLIQTNLVGQVECLPIKDLYSQRAFFCMKAGTKFLPVVQGGPIRLMVFDRYAHKGLGQIVKLELSDHEVPGTFAERGYSPEGTIEPGDFYAADLKTIQRIKTSGEVTQW